MIVIIVRERWGDDFSYLVYSLPTTAYTVFHYNQCSAMWEHWFWVYDRSPDQHWAKQTCQYCWMNTFRIRTWQIWECIWNWNFSGAVLTGSNHKLAATSPARPWTLTAFPYHPSARTPWSQVFPTWNLTISSNFLGSHWPPWLSYCVFTTLGIQGHLWFPWGTNIRSYGSK